VIGPGQLGEMIKSRRDTIDSKELTEVIDELVPVKERGEMRMAEFVNITCLPKMIAMELRRIGTQWQFIATGALTRNITLRFSGIETSVIRELGIRTFQSHRTDDVVIGDRSCTCNS
jgi:hypothetical protein